MLLSFLDNIDIALAVEITKHSQDIISLPTPVRFLPPTSMGLIKTFKMVANANAVYVHNGQIYAGLHNSKLMRVEAAYGGTPNPSVFMSIGSGSVCSIQVYGNEFYLFGSADKVYVYDFDKRLRRSWGHTSYSSGYCKLRVLNGKVVVPGQGSMSVYTLEGHLAKQIMIPGMSTHYKSLAVCGDDSVILSDYQANSVSRINIDSGEVTWTSKCVKEPAGVVCYNNRYVLVTTNNTDARIWILDINTGS